MVEWLPGGTMAFKRLTSVRLAIIDQQFYHRLYEALTREPPGEDRMFESQRKATRYVSGTVLKGVKARIIRYSVVMKRALETMERYSLLFGMGRIEVERIKIEAGGSILLKMPFDRYLLSAGITGVLEQIEGRAYTHQLSEIEDDTFKLDLDACEDDDYREVDFESMGLLAPVTAGGEGLSRCKQCGAPSALDSYNWDEIYGVIEDVRWGRRLAFVPCFTLTAVRKAAGYSEQEVAEAIEKSAYSSTLEQIEGGEGPSGIEELVDELPVKGWGKVTALETGEVNWKVMVFNPVDVSIIAGWLRAVYLSEMNSEPRISAMEVDDSVEYLLE
jgi:hypothetical protein